MEDLPGIIVGKNRLGTTTLSGGPDRHHGELTGRAGEMMVMAAIIIIECTATEAKSDDRGSRIGATMTKLRV